MVRLKTRYLLFEIIYPEGPLSDVSDKVQTHVDLRQVSESSLDSRRLAKLVREAITTYFGDQGMGLTASTIAVKYFSPTTNTGILRVSRDHFRIAWAALSYINDINGRKCIINVVKVSGTIRKCEEAAIERNQSSIDNALLRFADDMDVD